MSNRDGGPACCPLIIRESRGDHRSWVGSTMADAGTFMGRGRRGQVQSPTRRQMVRTLFTYNVKRFIYGRKRFIYGVRRTPIWVGSGTWRYASSSHRFGEPNDRTARAPMRRGQDCSRPST